MDSEESPYEILGVDPDASTEKIKKAYRSAALRNHPDKQQTDADRARATVTFAKISNAYEILSDPEQRRAYDTQQQQGAGNSPFFDDDFGARFHPHFHDPFQVFEHVFREEFGRPNMSSSRRSRDGAVHRDPFFDNMMDDPFFRGPSLFGGGSLFDSFFGVPPSHRYHDDIQRREISQRRRNDPFEEMQRMQQDMLRQMQQSMQEDARQPRQRDTSMYYSSSNIDSSTSSRNGGESVSTRTTTQVINGKRQTVTERIVRKADGTVERTVDRSGDEDFPIAIEQQGGEFPAIQGVDHHAQSQHNEGPVHNEDAGEPKRRRSGWFRR